MKRLVASVTLLAVAATAMPAVAGPHDGWKTTADVGRAGLVAAALLMAATNEDWEGVGELALSEGVTAGATWGLKHAISAERPNGANDESFPSGHASISFSAAAFVHQRYGWQWGLPAYAVAGVVGWARVESKHHHWYVVGAGAALGTATSFLLSSRYDDQVRLFPWSDGKGGGVAMNVRF